MQIPQSFIDDLVGRTNIAEIISGYLQLKGRGTNMFGICPFHSEKTPSFSVNSDKQMYYCFGCGKGGGVISFVMEIENLPFTEAVQFLAKRCGLEVPDSEDDGLAAQRRRMIQLNRDAARLFYDTLVSGTADNARDYLTQRRISKAMVTKFGIGAAPDSWTFLVDTMIKKGYTKQELIAAGLARPGKKGGGAYDAFRNRLMFPVIDVRGTVIGFSGRILSGEGAKYVNSPDTPVYNKRRSLFALNLAKKTKSGMLILAEGNIDVVALHQAGFDSAVASLGTAFTDDQARLMSRYSDNVVIAYDSDEAGKKATLRAVSRLEKTKMNIRVLELKDAGDPDEFLKKYGAEAFSLALGRSDNNVEYRLLAAEKEVDIKTDSGRLKFVEAAKEIVSSLKSLPEREVYGRRVAEITGISPESIAYEIEKAAGGKLKKDRKEQKKNFEQEALTVVKSGVPAGSGNAFSQAAEEGLIRILIAEPALAATADEYALLQEEFTSELFAKVYGIIRRRSSEGGEISEAMILASLSGGDVPVMANILRSSAALRADEKVVGDYIRKMRLGKMKTANPDDDMLMEIMVNRQNEEIGRQR